MINEIVNAYTRGTDSYATTLNESCDYIVNYKGTNNLPIEDDHGIAFYTDDHENIVGSTHQHNGRGQGAGRGRGRGARAGTQRRGRGPAFTSQISASPASSTVRSGNQDHVQFLMDQTDADNLEQGDEEYLSPLLCLNRMGTCLQAIQHSSDDGTLLSMLLIDSCSTVCLISNGTLLHNIFTTYHCMHVRCNAGMRTANKMGYLGNFPEPVWYDPNGIANILSLNRVKQHYEVQYKSSGTD